MIRQIILIAILGTIANGQSLLSAAKEGNINAIKAAVARGANLNQKTGSPTFFFGSSGYDKYGSLSYSEGSEWTPLIYASFHGHAEAVDYLLEKGANPEITDFNGMTALMWAIVEKKHDVISSFVERGVHLSKQEARFGMTMLMWSIVFGDSMTAMQIASSVENCKDKDTENWTALHYAANKDMSSLIPIIIQKGVDIDEANSEGNTALHLGILKGNFESVVALMRNGAKTSKTNKEGNNALNLAIGMCGLNGLVYEKQSEGAYIIKKGFGYQKNVTLDNTFFTVKDIKNGMFETEGAVPLGYENAVGVTWSFAKPGLIYHNGNYVYSSLIKGATISFKKDGVYLNGFEIKNEKSDKMDKMVAYLENISNR